LELPRGRSTPNARGSQRTIVVVAVAAVTGTLCVRAGSPGLAALVLAACAATWALCPAVAALATRCGACVRPGGRSEHEEAVPRLGGIALYVPIACALLWRGGPHAAALVAGATIVLAAGVWDDMKGLTPRRKIAAQVAAALVLALGGYRIGGLRVDPLGTLPITGFEGAALVAWIVFTTNAINLIDGVDGLATTIALIAAVAYAVLGAAPVLALALAGACLGFLRHNLPRARLFLGDTGSLLLGFLLGALPLAAPGPLNLPVALGLLAVPFGDVALCVARRGLRAKPLSAPDRGHLHHLLLRLWGHSAPRVLLGLGGLSAAQALVICLQPNLWGLLTAGCLLVGALAYVASRIRPDWPRLLLQRRAFRRVHLARNYALGALRICDSSEEVRTILHRVAEDLGLYGVEVSGLRIERAPSPRERLLVEQVDCGDAVASWSATEPGDPALLEETRIVMCDVLREASSRLGWCAPVAAAIPGDALPRAPAPRGRPAVHCVVENAAQLDRLATLVPAVQEGRPRAVVVFPGRSEDLARPPAVTAPVICLGLPPETDRGLLAGLVQACYRELLDREPPAVTVVVGDGSVASGCAMAARAGGVDVVQFHASRGLRDLGTRIRGGSGGHGIRLLRAHRGPPPPPGSNVKQISPEEVTP